MHGIIEGLFFLAGGTIGVLMGFSVIPKNPKNPDRQREWYNKFGKATKYLGIMFVIWGVLKIFRIC